MGNLKALSCPDWGLVKRNDYFEREMNVIPTKARAIYLSMHVRTVQAQLCINVHVVPTSICLTNTFVPNTNIR